MAEDTQEEEGTSGAQKVWFVLPGLGLLAIIVWLLSNMGAQSNGATLVRIVLAIVVVCAIVGALFMLLRRREQHDD